jgi:hypothetical protein
MFSLDYAVFLVTPVTAGASQRDNCNGSTLNRQRSLCLVLGAPAGTDQSGATSKMNRG